MPDGQVLEFARLTKQFGAVHAVEDLTARVQPGAVTGFLGPNGAGKTTTLRMLLGLVRPTSGSATIGGVPYAKLTRPLQTVGAVLEASSFHPGRTGANHLKVYAQAAGIAASRIDETLGLVGLSDAAGRKVGGYSLGMRQRLGLAYALLGDPGVLVLDEPANGLDPEGIKWLRGFLQQLAREGRTVLVSSHLLTEIQQTADAVLILANGRRVFNGTISDLVDPAEQVTIVDSGDRAALVGALRAAGIESEVLRSGVNVRGAEPAEVGKAAAAAGVALTALQRRGPALEEVFLELVSGVRVHPSADSDIDTLPLIGAPEAAVAAAAPVAEEAAVTESGADAGADTAVAETPSDDSDAAQAAEGATEGAAAATVAELPADGADAAGPGAADGAPAGAAAVAGAAVAAAAVAGAAVAVAGDEDETSTSSGDEATTNDSGMAPPAADAGIGAQTVGDVAAAATAFVPSSNDHADDGADESGDGGGSNADGTPHEGATVADAGAPTAADPTAAVDEAGVEAGDVAGAVETAADGPAIETESDQADHVPDAAVDSAPDTAPDTAFADSERTDSEGTDSDPAGDAEPEDHGGESESPAPQEEDASAIEPGDAADDTEAQSPHDAEPATLDEDSAGGSDEPAAEAFAAASSLDANADADADGAAADGGAPGRDHDEPPVMTGVTALAALGLHNDHPGEPGEAEASEGASAPAHDDPLAWITAAENEVAAQRNAAAAEKDDDPRPAYAVASTGVIDIVPLTASAPAGDETDDDADDADERVYEDDIDSMYVTNSAHAIEGEKTESDVAADAFFAAFDGSVPHPAGDEDADHPEHVSSTGSPHDDRPQNEDAASDADEATRPDPGDAEHADAAAPDAAHEDAASPDDAHGTVEAESDESTHDDPHAHDEEGDER